MASLRSFRAQVVVGAEVLPPRLVGRLALEVVLLLPSEAQPQLRMLRREACTSPNGLYIGSLELRPSGRFVAGGKVEKEIEIDRFSLFFLENKRLSHTCVNTRSLMSRLSKRVRLQIAVDVEVRL